MYHNKHSFTKSFRGHDRAKSFGRAPKRNHRTFDPSHLVGKAVVQKEEVYVPKNNFSDFVITDQLKQNIATHGYTKPTPIQDQAIPAGLAGQDVVGIVKTGTGKTAGFLIPLINKVIHNRSQKVLIVTPTRELAVQIENEFKIFAKNTNIWSVLCIGGVGLGNQIYKLNRNPNFVVGTPGRLIDLEKQRKLNFSNYNNIVLDEVDRILDMGFIDSLNYILTRLPHTRQSFFFSATMPSNVENIARSFLKNPVKIALNSNLPAANVDQDVIRINGTPKIEVLHDLLVTKGFDKVLIFGRTKHGIEKLSRELERRGFRVEAIHGNKSQNQRQRALESFKCNRVQVLLATDIVARGVDIDDITHVINYDLPETYEDYIHRIGRTGRANKKGLALTFIETASL